MKAVSVKLYSTTTCPYCMMEKAWLDEKKVEHNIVYVDHNMKEAMEMVKETGQMGVPVTNIKYDNGEEEYVIGFDKPRLSKILKVN